jgi:hypothetical protein
MESFDNFTPDVPMSIKMRRAREAFKRMTPEEQIYTLVEAGLMTEAEYQQAVERYQQKQARQRKPKPRRKPTRSKPEFP